MFPPHVKEIEVLFYTKPNCPLCDRAHELLEIAAKSKRIRINTVNILTDPAVYEHYQDRIPVLSFPDGSILEAPIRRKELMQTLIQLTTRQ